MESERFDNYTEKQCMDDYKIADEFGPVSYRSLWFFIPVYEIKAYPAQNKINEYNNVNIQ